MHGRFLDEFGLRLGSGTLARGAPGRPGRRVVRRFEKPDLGPAGGGWPGLVFTFGKLDPLKRRCVYRHDRRVVVVSARLLLRRHQRRRRRFFRMDLGPRHDGASRRWTPAGQRLYVRRRVPRPLRSRYVSEYFMSPSKRALRHRHAGPPTPFFSGKPPNPWYFGLGRGWRRPRRARVRAEGVRPPGRRPPPAVDFALGLSGLSRFRKPALPRPRVPLRLHAVGGHP